MKLGILSAPALALALAGAVSGTGARAQSGPNNNWSGLYLGASVGAGRSADKWAFPLDGSNADQTGHGGLAGFQAGYNLQTGSILAGIEADYMWAGIKSSASCAGGALTCSTDLKNLGSVRGRLGWVATPSAMFYFTGGLGFGQTNWTVKDATGAAIGAGGISDYKTGFVFGGGAEIQLVKNWSLKGEYLRYNFSSTSGVPGFSPSDLKANTDTFKLGLNYRF